ncbi:hypothetical protein F5Y07DRAFT_382936 [Xylaria sp. FL0933]|nr:hypothetical protein F5Y07DRAFT_382936 [Xylaria sp. FL0933]
MSILERPYYRPLSPSPSTASSFDYSEGTVEEGLVAIQDHNPYDYSGSFWSQYEAKGAKEVKHGVVPWSQKLRSLPETEATPRPENRSTGEDEWDSCFMTQPIEPSTHSRLSFMEQPHAASYSKHNLNVPFPYVHSKLSPSSSSSHRTLQQEPTQSPSVRIESNTRTGIRTRTRTRTSPRAARARATPESILRPITRATARRLTRQTTQTHRRRGAYGGERGNSAKQSHYDFWALDDHGRAQRVTHHVSS